MVSAQNYVRRVSSGSHPAVFRDKRGDSYFVKGRQIGRAAVTDHIVGEVGMMIGAPVASVVLVDVPDFLVRYEPELNGEDADFDEFWPGVGHGSLEIPGCEDRFDIQNYSHGANRDRFASLAILYGLFHASDRQYLYERHGARRPWSHDHGDFLPGRIDWTVASLRGALPAKPDQKILEGAGLSYERLRQSAQALRLLTDEKIATAVASPPNCWGIRFLERVELAAYLAVRRNQLLAFADGYV